MTKQEAEEIRKSLGFSAELYDRFRIQIEDQLWSCFGEGLNKKANKEFIHEVKQALYEILEVTTATSARNALWDEVREKCLNK